MRLFERGPSPRRCGLATITTKPEQEQIPTGKMVMDINSKAYQTARRQHALAKDGKRKTIDHYYAEAGGVYVPETYARDLIIGTVSCRFMERKGVEPVVHSSTFMESTAVKDVAKLVTERFCKAGCPFVGMDELQAAQYEADVATAEAVAAERVLAAREAIKTVNDINKTFGEQPPIISLPSPTEQQ